MSEARSAQEIEPTAAAPEQGGAHAAGLETPPVQGSPATAAPAVMMSELPGYQEALDIPVEQEMAGSQGAERERIRRSLSTCMSPEVIADPLAGADEPRPVWSRRIPGKDKVAIVGFSTNHRHLAPLDDPAYEIWGMNNAYLHLKRADRWFELHSEDQYGWDLRRPGEHVEWLRRFKGPLYLINARTDMPNSISYPYDDVIGCVGPYLTSGPALMLGFAMLEGFRHISIFGIDLATHTEYADQKPGFEFLLGMAMGREITVELPQTCELLKGPVYGRGDVNPGGEHRTRKQFEGRLKALAKRKTEAMAQLRQQELTIARIEGAELESRYWIGQTPEGGQQGIMMNAAMQRVAEEKGRGGVLLHHPTGDLADPARLT